MNWVLLELGCWRFKKLSSMVNNGGCFIILKLWPFGLIFDMRMSV